MLWKAQVIPILRGHGLLAYVINDISSLELTIIGTYGTLQSNPAAATWLRIDQLILGWINSSLQDGPLSQAINNENSSLLDCPLSQAINSEFPPTKTHLPDISIKLASNNYMLWKAQVIPILRGYGLLGYVTNDISCPELTIIGADSTLQSNLAATTWLCTDQLILGWINSSFLDNPLSQAINSESCHDAWIVLETLYGSHT
uniref:Retrotransposon Copia-like N-terminal domain-containing protein n=1 Tax=Populus alba TaxID=43335 RepID=A0A4U5MBP2_POPAL|nr:hypothetical protein D5086_0000310060 [Populus alba]